MKFINIVVLIGMVFLLAGCCEREPDDVQRSVFTSSIGSLNGVYINLTLELDGVNATRKYEYETTANITAYSNCTTCNVCIDLYAPGYGVNSSCGINHTELNYKVGFILKEEFNDSSIIKEVSDGEIFYINVTGDIVNVSQLLINGTGSPENISIAINGSSVFQSVGFLNLTELQNDKFTNNLKNETLLYSRTGAKTRYINYSVGDLNLFDYRNLTFNLSGSKAMSENLYFVDEFNSSSYINSSRSNVSGTWPWDDFCMGVIPSRYANTYSHTGVTPLEVSTGIDAYPCENITFGSWYRSYTGAGEGSVTFNTETYTQTLDFDRYKSFNTTIYFLVGCSANLGECSGYGRLGIKKAGTCYPLYAHPTVASTPVNFQFIKNSTHINLYTDGTWNNSMTYNEGETLEMCISGDMSWGWGSSDTQAWGTGYINATIYNFNISGLAGINKGNFTWANASIVSKPLKTFTDNITLATMTIDGDIPFGTSADLYLSPDGGANWENVINGSSHTFTIQNNTLLYLINLTTKDTQDSNPPTYSNIPRIYKVEVEVASGFPQNISIDFGGDETIDWNMTGEINDTESELVTINYSTVEAYMRGSNCRGLLTCKIPITIYSYSDGNLFYKDIRANLNLKGVDLNRSAVENYLKEVPYQIQPNITYDGGTINLSKVNVTYLGEEDIKVYAHIAENASINETYFISVRYSPFNFSFPKHLDGYYITDIYNLTQFNITPYGQKIKYCTNNNKSKGYCENMSIPIYNITSLAKIDDAKIFMKINQSFGCVNMTFDDDINKTGGIIVNNITGQEVISNLSISGTKGIWSWVDLYDCNSTLLPYYEFGTFFYSRCHDCVDTDAGDVYS